MKKNSALNAIVVYITAKDVEEGRKIAAHLLKERLAACVNVIPAIESHYWWDGRLEHASEVLLILKTQRKLFSVITKAVKAVHSYQVPEIIALPIVCGDPPYLKWLKRETL